MIDVRKVKVLGKLLLKLETKSRTGSGKKLLLLNLSYLLPGVFLPWLIVKQSTDSSGFELVFLTYLFYSLIIVFTLITELDNLIISKTETELLASMPVEDILLVRAKMYMLLRYTIFLSIPLLAPGAVYYYMFIKSLPRAVLYIACGFMLFYFIVNVITLLYSAALRVFKANRLSTYTLFFQLTMVLIMILGYQVISFGAGKQGSSAGSYLHIMQSRGIIDFFPQAWFALIPARNNYAQDFSLMLKLILPLFICYMGYFSLRFYLEENYHLIREKFLNAKFFSTSGSSEKRSIFRFSFFSDFIWHSYLRNNLERSSFGLIKSLYKSDKTVKLAIVPMVIIPAGLGFFAMITNQLSAPFGSSYAEYTPVFHISILLCVLIVLNTAMLGVRITNYPGVSWVYQAYPVDSLKHFKNGFRKFFNIYLLLPLCIVLGIIFSVKIPAGQSIVHILFIFAAANLYNTLFNMFSKALPFTKENTIVNSLQKISSILFPVAFGTLMVLVQLFVYRNLLTASICVLLLFTITFWLNYFGFVRKGK